MNPQNMNIFWNGPHDWPKLRQKSPLDDISGVYMKTVVNSEGYVVYGFGVTTRSVRTRLGEHRRKMLRGMYTLFDLDEMKLGIRTEIWHGMWAGHDSDERKAEFASREEELQDVAREHMAAFKIFAAEVPDVRIQHRMEAALMAALYAAPKPFCDLPDKNVHLVPRRDDESPITISNVADHSFCNLPKTVEI